MTQGGVRILWSPPSIGTKAGGSVRKSFPGHYVGGEPFFKHLWEKGTFVLDANMLLNFFRYSAKTRQAFYDFLKRNEQRLWLPHHAAAEYHRNLHTVRYERIAALDGIRDHLKAQWEQLKQDEFRANVDELVALAEKLRDEAKKKYREEDDAWVQRIADLYDGRVGSEWSRDQLAKLFKEGEDRFKNKIPPGYKDTSKGGDAKFGDLIVWKQLIEHAKTAKTPIILVTDDTKEDWWQRSSSGERTGPRPELLSEMAREAPDAPFYMYSGRRFLDQANDKAKAELSPEALKEIDRVKPTPAWPVPTGIDPRLLGDGYGGSGATGATGPSLDVLLKPFIGLGGSVPNEIADLVNHARFVGRMEGHRSGPMGLPPPDVHAGYYYGKWLKESEQQQGADESVDRAKTDERVKTGSKEDG